MKNMRERVLALILAMVMSLSLFSASAWAAKGADASVSAEKAAALTPQAMAANGACGDKVTWTLDDEGTLTISGAGAMTNYDGKGPWSEQYDVKQVVIQKGVTSIGEKAFSDCISLERVEIPDKITTIGEDAFCFCASLKAVTIPATMKRIDAHTFGCCLDIEYVPYDENFTISGYTGSAAGKYAKDNNFKFVDSTPAHVHTWNAGSVTTPATCKDKGVKLFTCSGCGKTKIEVIAKNPNKHAGGTETRNAKAATCVAAGYSGDTHCKGCGAKLSSGKKIPATGEHSWDNGTVTKQPTTTTKGVKTFTCKVCQATKNESIPKLSKKKNAIKCKNSYTLYSKSSNQKFKLKVQGNKTPLTYICGENVQASDKGDGCFYIKGGVAGKLTITIHAAETDTYLPATKKVTLNVIPVLRMKVQKGGKTVVASWSDCIPLDSYLLQISRKKNFKSVLRTYRITDNKTKVKNLKPGVYYARVRMKNEKGKNSGWSEVQSFKIKK